MFGLKENDIAEIRAVLQNFLEVEEVFIFGSRAKGNYKRGSDVDIAIKGKKATYKTASDIAGILNEDTTMPYHFDVLSYQELNDKDLLGHIDRNGQLFYRANTTAIMNEPSAEYKKKSE